MVLTCFPFSTTPFYNKISHTAISHHHHHHHHHKNNSHKFANLSTIRFKRNRHSIKTESILASASKGSNEGDNRALETVLKLYTAIKSNNLSELSDIIGDECFCICNFLSTIQTFHGKKQVIEFFTCLMRNLGNKFEFVVQPTMHHGMTVGVSWKLECNKTHVPLGTGFSLHMCHVYQGKVLIRNVEMFMEPLMHIEPFKLKMVGFLMNLVGSEAVLKGEKRRIAYFVCTLILLATLFFLLRLYRN